MSFAAKAYLAAVLGTGAILLARFLPAFRPEDPVRFTAYFLVALIASSLKIKLPGIRGTMSVLFLFLLMGVVELSLPETLVIAVFGSLVQSFWQAKERPKLIHLSFNAAGLVIASAFAHSAYTAPMTAAQTISTPVRLFAAIVAFFVANTLAVAVIIALTEGKSIVATWRNCYLWSFPYYLGGACIVGLFGVVGQRAGWQAALLILPVVYLVYRSYRIYLDRIEETRLHTDQLKAAANRLQSVLESTTDCVFATSADFHISYANQRARARLFPEHEPVGTLVWEAFPKLAVGDFGDQIRAAVKEGTTMATEHFFPDLNAWFEVHVYPSMDAVAFYLKEVTEQRELSEQLRQAQKMEAIGRLAGGVAHDFNNLLTIILGYGQIAADTLPENHESGAAIQAVMQAGESASTLTQRLLAFSRKQILEPEVLDLNVVVTGIESMLKRLIGEDVIIEVKLDAAIGKIRADHHQLEQVILNLAVNARDAMPGGGKLSISTYPAFVDAARAAAHGGSPGPHSVLSVKDTGCGMDDQTRTKIFEPFFTTKGTGKGTGLGLPIVYGTIQQSGGFLTVESEIGVGSVFEVFMPCVEGVHTRKSPEVQLHRIDRSGRILLIEDDDSVRRLTESLLKQAGYVVTALHEPGSAMRLSASQVANVDLLVTDMVMPGISGPEIAEQLLLLRPEMKVIYVSGYSDHPSVTEGSVGERGLWLQKPFTRDELLAKVHTALLGRPGADNDAQL